MNRLDQTASNTAFSGKVDTGFPSENAIGKRAFSGKVDTGFPSENATMDAPTAIKRRICGAAGQGAIELA
jgi:hypothetical protein